MQQTRHLGRAIWEALPLNENDALGLAAIARVAGASKADVAQYLARWRLKGVIGTRPDAEHPTWLRRWRLQEAYCSVAVPKAALIRHYLAQ